MQRILESILYSSVEAVIKLLESRLLEEESSELNPEHFIQLQETDKPDLSLQRRTETTEKINGRPFFLDDGKHLPI